MKYRSMIIGVLAVLVVAAGCFLFLKKGDPVDSTTEAIHIAQAYVNKKYGQEFSDCNIHAALEDNIWVVDFWVEQEGTDDIVAGGGTPIVEIKQSNGKVISCLLSK